MSAAEQIPEAEIVEEEEPREAVSTALAVRPGSTDLIRAASPAEQIEKAVEMATALDKIIKDRGMRTKMGRRKVVKPDGSEVWEDSYHTNVEAWQTLATFLRVAIVPDDPEPIRDDEGNVKFVSYEVAREVYPKGTKGAQIRSGNAVPEHVEHAMVEGAEGFTCRCLVYKDGVVVGAGSSRCTRLEEAWRSKPDYALEGMAQTRAIGRSMATPGRWIVTLAGYNGTPAEEMPPQFEQEPIEAGPKHGPAAVDQQLANTRLALGYLLSCEPDQNPVGAMLNEIERRAGGYLPHLPLATISLAAQAVKDRRERQKAKATTKALPDRALDAAAEEFTRDPDMERAEAILAAEHGAQA
jgi:hypothetical protein